MSKRTYFPDRGDFVHVNFSPSAGHEQAGGHYGLVLSTASFAKVTGQAFICPITSRIRGWPLEVLVPKGLLPPKQGQQAASQDEVTEMIARKRGLIAFRGHDAFPGGATGVVDQHVYPIGQSANLVRGACRIGHQGEVDPDHVGARSRRGCGAQLCFSTGGALRIAAGADDVPALRSQHARSRQSDA